MSAPEDNGGLVSAADTAGAGAAGVGGGTVVSVLASSLPDGFAKTVLIWLAPTATVAASALWIWARRRVVAHFDERYAKREFDAARTAIADALSNPSLTAEQRAEFEAKRVELDQMVVERRMAFATAHARGNRGSDRPGVRGG